MAQSISPISNVPNLNLAQLEPSNYLIWSQSMVAFLVSQGLWEVIEPTSVPKDNEAWRIKNKMALHAIRTTCDPPTLSQIYDIRSAKIAWNTLAKMSELRARGLNLADPSSIALLLGVNLGDLSGLTTTPFIRMVPFVGPAYVALDLIRRCPSLTIFLTNGDISSFLALKSTEFDSSNLIFWKRWIYSLINTPDPDPLDDEFGIEVSQLNQNSIAPGDGLFWYTLKLLGMQERFWYTLKLLGVKQIFEMKLKHDYAIKILRYIQQIKLPTGLILNSKTFETLKACPQMYYADIVGLTEFVENGTFESVIEILKACPQSMYYADIFGRHMIMVAISYRREEIYSLVYGLKTHEKTGWISHVDYFGNNMLHLAGMLAPSSRLAKISGAALQMQRELQWFKEVESIVLPYQKEMKNMDGETPEQVFENSHKQLMADGEKWMKRTATSSTVVGALIVTIMFAAISTVPTSSALENRKPSFSWTKAYLVFVISDSISLFASSTSVLTFLGILTSSFAREDFLKSLPTKLIIGLSTLFISIATMMMTFCSTLMMMLEGQLHLVVPIILLGSLPVTLYMYLQFPLFVEIFMHTYGHGIFKKNIKQWY